MDIYSILIFLLCLVNAALYFFDEGRPWAILITVFAALLIVIRLVYY